LAVLSDNGLPCHGSIVAFTGPVIPGGVPLVTFFWHNARTLPQEKAKERR
jgi:hypothetical protein